MPRQKKIVDEEINVEKVVESTDKDAIIEQQKQEIDSFKDKYAKLEGMLEILMKQATNTPSQVVVNQEEEVVNIGCHAFKEMIIVLDKNREIYFKPEKFTTLSVEDTRKIVQNKKYSKFLEKGVLYFEEEKNYKRFRVEKRIELSNDNLAEIISGENVASVYSELDKITDFKKSLSMYNMILFRICGLITSGKYPNISKNHMYIDQYFDGKLGYAMSMADTFKPQN